LSQFGNRSAVEGTLFHIVRLEIDIILEIRYMPREIGGICQDTIWIVVRNEASFFWLQHNLSPSFVHEKEMVAGSCIVFCNSLLDNHQIFRFFFHIFYIPTTAQ